MHVGGMVETYLKVSYKESLFPPRESYAKHLEVGVSYFFLQECFGIVMMF